MKLDGLHRQESVERFLGVTAAEAASYVADEIFRVCVDIDLHVEALLAEKPLPKRCKDKQSIKDLGFLANVFTD